LSQGFSYEILKKESSGIKKEKCEEEILKREKEYFPVNREWSVKTD